jgi:hypothetical protein
MRVSVNALIGDMTIDEYLQNSVQPNRSVKTPAQDLVDPNVAWSRIRYCHASASCWGSVAGKVSCRVDVAALDTARIMAMVEGGKRRIGLRDDFLV